MEHLAPRIFGPHIFSEDAQRLQRTLEEHCISRDEHILLLQSQMDEQLVCDARLRSEVQDQIAARGKVMDLAFQLQGEMDPRSMRLEESRQVTSRPWSETGRDWCL